MHKRKLFPKSLSCIVIMILIVKYNLDYTETAGHCFPEYKDNLCIFLILSFLFKSRTSHVEQVAFIMYEIV